MGENKVKVDTIVRTIVLIVALTNQVLAIAGKDTLPIYENDIVQIVTIIATLASSAWSWWKNNSFTQEAIKADEYKDRLKNQ